MILVFVSYNLGIFIKYGQLGSISASYYALPEKLNFLFCLFCFGYAIPGVMLATTGLMFFGSAFITCVGIASAFRESDFTAGMHQWSAAIAITLTQLSILVDYHMWWVNVIFLVVGGILFLLRNKFYPWMYWLEMTAFVCTAYVLGKVSL